MLLVNPRTGHLFVACGDEVKIYDTLNWSLITSIPVPAGADEGIASDPMLTRVFVTSQESDALTVIQDDGQPQVVFAGDRLARRLNRLRHNRRLRWPGECRLG